MTLHLSRKLHISRSAYTIRERGELQGLSRNTLGLLFHRLRLFVRPGGLVIFDVKSPNWFRSLDGEIFVDEREDLLCLWRADLDEERKAIVYGMDLFERRGSLWQRSGEEHVEYIHEPETLCKLLAAEGFFDLRVDTDGPQHEAGRVFVIARRDLNYETVRR